MRSKRWYLVGVFVVLALAFGIWWWMFSPIQAAYGVIEPYSAGRPLHYPAFTMEYVGQHRVSSDRYPRGFLYYDFRTRQGELEQLVSWTDGTGVLGPVNFEFNGAPYTLELRQRNNSGPFSYGTLIVEQTQPSS